MIRVSLPILSCIILASTFTARTEADDASGFHKSDGDRTVVTTTTDLHLKKWDVVVFKCAADSNHNYIKRLVVLPGEVVVMDNGELRPAGSVIDTIKAQDARIEVKHDAIRIEGGTVEIQRTFSPK